MPELSNRAKSLMWFANRLPDEVKQGYLCRLEKMADKNPAYSEVVSEMYHAQQSLYNPSAYA